MSASEEPLAEGHGGPLSRQRLQVRPDTPVFCKFDQKITKAPNTRGEARVLPLFFRSLTLAGQQG